MPPVRRYAEGTTTSVDSSRGEISGILTKHGVKRMGWVTEPEADQLMFEIGGRQYRLEMKRPTAESLRKRDGNQYTYPANVDWVKKAEAEWKRIWRANVMLLKAKLEFAADGDVTSVEREMLPYLVLKDGRTLAQSLDGLQMLAAGK